MKIKITVKSPDGDVTVIDGDGSEAAEKLRRFNSADVPEQNGTGEEPIAKK